MTAPANVRTCYRHPDRVAGIICQRCDRPICPSCMNQASVGFHCPECAKRGGQKVYQGVAALRARPIVTQVLIGINVAVYALTLASWLWRPFTEGGGLLDLRRYANGDRAYSALTADGSLFGRFVADEPWRLVTSGFLHVDDIPFGFLHIGLNMWVLWVLGQFLEPAMGKARFLALYGCALLSGSLGVILWSDDAVTVGASGAIYGLMGGALLVARERNIDLWRSGLVTTLAINLLLTFGISGISIGGHIGGLVGGALGGLVLTEGAKRMGKDGEKIAVALTVVLGLAAGGVAYALMAAKYGSIASQFGS